VLVLALVLALVEECVAPVELVLEPEGFFPQATRTRTATLGTSRRMPRPRFGSLNDGP
jgi:hypothetical protein